jgi:hypothetical protein
VAAGGVDEIAFAIRGSSSSMDPPPGNRAAPSIVML